MAQENKNFCKRLSERSSFYNSRKMQQDYELNQYYKQNICEYPSIDFTKSKGILSRSSEDIYSGPIRQFSKGLPPVSSYNYNNHYHNKSNSNLQNNSYNLYNNNNRNDIYHNDTFAPGSTINFDNSSQIELQNLGVCNVEIIYEEIK